MSLCAADIQNMEITRENGRRRKEELPSRNENEFLGEFKNIGLGIVFRHCGRRVEVSSYALVRLILKFLRVWEEKRGQRDRGPDNFRKKKKRENGLWRTEQTVTDTLWQIVLAYSCALASILEDI